MMPDNQRYGVWGGVLEEKDVREKCEMNLDIAFMNEDGSHIVYLYKRLFHERKKIFRIHFPDFFKLQDGDLTLKF